MPTGQVTEGDHRQCPYCKEDILRDATVCRYCRSRVPADKPPHGGVCPFCKEEIHPEAVKCKHCGSTLVRLGNPGRSHFTADCGCGSRSDVMSRSDRRSIGRRAPSPSPGRFGPFQDVIIGGEADPGGDEWYCDGYYWCIDLLGIPVCIWICHEY
jgi:Double zinc ribbon